MRGAEPKAQVPCDGGGPHIHPLLLGAMPARPQPLQHPPPTRAMGRRGAEGAQRWGSSAGGHRSPRGLAAGDAGSKAGAGGTGLTAGPVRGSGRSRSPEDPGDQPTPGALQGTGGLPPGRPCKRAGSWSRAGSAAHGCQPGPVRSPRQLSEVASSPPGWALKGSIKNQKGEREKRGIFAAKIDADSEPRGGKGEPPRARLSLQIRTRRQPRGTGLIINGKGFFSSLSSIKLI